MFDCRGLLPWQSRDSLFLTPSAFSPTKWSKRKLTALEMSKAFDIPNSLWIQIPFSLQTKVLADHVLFPTKCSITPLDVLLGKNENEETQTHSHMSLPSTLPPNSPTGPDIKATKSDDASVPVGLWNDRVPSDQPTRRNQLLDFLRRITLCWYRKKKHRQGFLLWFKAQYSFLFIKPTSYYINSHQYKITLKVSRILHHPMARRDWLAGQECVERCSNTSWWEWDLGSRPLFWRWNTEYQAIIRDGLPLWCTSTLPTSKTPQRQEPDPNLREAVQRKLIKVRNRKYLQPGLVKSLTSYFSVPKGENDIRLVYDGTKSGLNGTLWSPWFRLPTIEQHLRSVELGTFMGDLDIADMFLNFMLHPAVQPYAGVDLTPFFPEELTALKHTVWERWTRCAMGFRPSPYQSIQVVLHAEELIRGDPFNPRNIFRFDAVILNLPGDLNYSPVKPWVFKWRTLESKLACDLFLYVDDCRVTGSSSDECWLAGRVVGSMFNFLGIQDAPCKRRFPSTNPGAWAGSIASSSHDRICISISQERWDKTKSILDWMDTELHTHGSFPHNTLERHRGFLVYVSRTYPMMVPYLKGIHLTLDSWRPWRSPDGWKIVDHEVSATLQELGLNSKHPIKAPTNVTAVPSLASDDLALQQLFTGPTPTQWCVRPTRCGVAYYDFADASGLGFGSSFLINGTLHYRTGQWASSYS